MSETRLGFWILAVALLAFGCGKIDWATWGFGLERQGNNPLEQTIGPSNVAQLRHLWSVDLGAAIDTAPIVAANIDVGGTPTDLVYAGSEHGQLVAVRAADGGVVWSRNLGSQQTDCFYTPDAEFGVSASPVFDRAGNRLFVVGGDGNVYALDPATGTTLAGWPVQFTSDPLHNFVLSAPSLFGGQLYVETASRCDAPPYRGRIVAIDTATGARTRFWVTGKNGPLGGGIWGWGGASIDPLNGDVFVATGNALGSPQDFPYADRVVRLTGSLLVQAAHDPGPQMPDDDFGSTPVLFQKSGCPPQLVTEQKNGFLYLYDRDAIATGFRQRIAVSGGGDFIGVPAYSPQTQMVYVVNPHQPVGGAYTHGMLAFSVNSKCNLHLAWQTTVGDNNPNIGSTPTVANGVVYYGDGVHNTIHGFDASTGAPLWTSGSDVAGFVFAAPVVVNGQLFAGSYDQHLHAWGL